MFARKIIPLFLSVLTALGNIPGARGEGVDHAARYRACMAMVEKNPQQAFGEAARWRDLGGGEGAEHCAAVALIGLGQYREAASRLEELALDSKRPPQMKARILSQASQAWLLADMAERAEATATAALTLSPEDASILIDRAQARAFLKDYKGALADLDASLQRHPGDIDALVFRATAKRFLDDLSGAAVDIEAALRVNGTQPDALLERGILKRLSKNDTGAREDWLRVLSVAPESDAATAARANLEKMDVVLKP